MLTPWGYSVDSISGIITVSQFNSMTGNRWASDSRIESAIASASASIRAYCGWHVAPSLSCTIVLDGEQGDIWLPTCGLTAVSSVEFDGVEHTVIGFNQRGRVRTAEKQPAGIGNVEVSYTAGFDLTAMPDLADVVKGRVIAAIALTSYGVSQETAGSLSISYSGSALSDAGGYFLPPDVRAMLAPYKLVSAHAA